jgi:jumonji domain-containing protein 7
MWIGTSKSVTAMHKDNYENIYCQIVGQKHFVLLPPVAFPCVGEQQLQAASYVRQEDGSLVMVDEAESIPFATWDPDEPSKHTTKYSHLAKPMRVTLEAGDMMYLPAMWYVDTLLGHID